MDIGELGSITFGPGDMVSDPPKCIPVTATADGVPEPDEDLMLALGSTDERVLFSPHMATVTISGESLHACPPPPVQLHVHTSFSTCHPTTPMNKTSLMHVHFT